MYIDISTNKYQFVTTSELLVNNCVNPPNWVRVCIIVIHIHIIIVGFPQYSTCLFVFS